jgi:hypothetical protein
MCPSVDDLQVIIEKEGTLIDCIGTRDTFVRCCILFRESGQFEVPISFAKIGSLLRIDAKTARNHWKQFKKVAIDYGATGRPRLLSEAQMGAVVDFALAEFHALCPTSCNRFLWFLRSEFHIDLIPDSFRVMPRRNPTLKAIVGHPMEIQQVQASPETLIEYFDNLQRILGGVRRVFVWNMDEIGHADWPDAHPDIVYVQHDYSHPTVSIGVNRTGKRITLIGCVCADGSSVKPMMIIPCHTVDLIFSFSLRVQSSEYPGILPQRRHYVTLGRGGFADVPC